LLLLDNSAWSRLLTGSVPKRQAERIAGWMDEQQLAVCLPFLLEAGYSARSAGDHAKMVGRLEQLPRVPVEEKIERAALEAQRELASIGHHRLPPTDLVIAACADQAAGGVLHCDGDYDLILQHTRLSFDSIWVTET
jgi:predicted nucleic acid-binding protein